MAKSKGKQLSLSSFLGLPLPNKQTESNKLRNRIYLSSDEEDDFVSTNESKASAAVVKEYVYENSSQSPLSVLKTATRVSPVRRKDAESKGTNKNKLFSTKTKDEESESKKHDANDDCVIIHYDEKESISNKSPDCEQIVSPITLNCSNEEIIKCKEDSFDMLVNDFHSSKSISTANNPKKEPRNKCSNTLKPINISPIVLSPKRETIFSSSRKNNNESEDERACKKLKEDNVNKPESSQISVNFDENLEEFMSNIIQNDKFKSPTEQVNLNHLHIQAAFVKNSYMEVMEKYCQIIDQIPATFFNVINGFDITTFLKLNLLRQKCKAKIKLVDKNIEQRMKCQPEEDDIDRMLAEEADMQQEQNEYSNILELDNEEEVEEKKENIAAKIHLHEDVRLREELVHDLCEESDTELQNQTLNSSLAEANDDMDYCELDALINDMKDEDDLLKGRKSVYNDLSLKDYEDQLSKKPSKSVKKSKELDDDGWEIYDPQKIEFACSQAESTKKLGKPNRYSDIVDLCDTPNTSSSSKILCNFNTPVRDANADKSNKQLTKSAQKVAGDFYTGQPNDGITGEFDGLNYDHSERLMNALQYNFGLKSFRPNQLQVINAALTAHNCFVSNNYRMLFHAAPNTVHV